MARLQSAGAGSGLEAKRNALATHLSVDISTRTINLIFPLRKTLLTKFISENAIGSNRNLKLKKSNRIGVRGEVVVDIVLDSFRVSLVGVKVPPFPCYGVIIQRIISKLVGGFFH